jgi:SAM-dependent methyltransferase
VPKRRAEFDTYFDERATRFAAFYGSERVARLLGRGALFDRLRGAVEIASSSGARRVLDVGCGSGPLLAPLAALGIGVEGIDPAPAMVALAQREAGRYPDRVTVRQGAWEEIDEVDAYDLAVALGVFDYVDDPLALLRRLLAAAPRVVSSFPAPGLRLRLRQLRYGARGVAVHGYEATRISRLAEAAGARIEELRPLSRAGFLAHFARRTG